MADQTPQVRTPPSGRRLDAPGPGGLTLGAAPAAAAAAAADPAPRRPLSPPKEPKGGWWWGTGRRKTAVARVRLRPAAAEPSFRIQITSNRFKTVDEYFAEIRDRQDCTAPLQVTGMNGKVDVVVRVDGGGFMGQAGAVKLGLARALKGYDPTLEQALRDHGMLTRDSRDVERKKYGQAGARRRFQFSKR